ncbi:MAG: DUF3786 domain-containing protein [Anaerolineales bacterium]|nr:DUF3786 domain-containing protein [Anaerolineales bacterium]
MTGLTDQAGGPRSELHGDPKKAREVWQESMLRRIDQLRGDLQDQQPQLVADRCGAEYKDECLVIPYWGEKISIRWLDLEAVDSAGEPLSTFDTAMIIYHLHTSDGAPMADRWISFRELPNGAFYNQAFQGYSGDRVAQHFGTTPERFEAASQALEGLKLSSFADHAYAFQPLPRVRMAAVLWPGDDEFPAKASVLFDAAAYHYMTTDGLALLGAGLTHRLIGMDATDKN